METQTQKTEAESIIEKAKISEESGGSQFMNPQPKEIKKGRGRPKKVDSEKSQAESPKKTEEKSGPKINIPTKTLMYPAVKMISMGGVSFTGDARAAVTSDEADAMAEALGMLADKWMPDLMASWGPEAMCALVFAQYGTRLYAIKKLQEEKLRQTATPTPQARPQAEVRPFKVVEDIPDVLA